MNRIELSERLMKIAAHIRPEDVVADVGTDHGYLPIWLMQNDAAAGVIISDINEGPLEKAAFHIQRYQACDEPDLRLGGGLTVLKPGEAGVIVIAGMGGILISRILDESPEVVRKARMLILQPRNHAFELREYLRNLDGFTRCEEEVAREGRKFSEIITVKRDDCLEEADRRRLARTAELETELGLDRRLYDEVPAMLLADVCPANGRLNPVTKPDLTRPETAEDAFSEDAEYASADSDRASGNDEQQRLIPDYLQYKCRGEHIVIENITRNGKSAYADERLERARFRLAAFEKMLDMAEGGRGKWQQ